MYYAATYIIDDYYLVGCTSTREGFRNVSGGGGGGGGFWLFFTGGGIAFVTGVVGCGRYTPQQQCLGLVCEQVTSVGLY